MSGHPGIRRLALAGSTALIGALASAGSGHAQTFVAGDLLVSSSAYAGTAATVTIGQALPGGGNAVANGAYPNVFQNATVDPSFGVTSPLALSQYAIGGTSAAPTLALRNTLDITGMTGIVTSFASKSEGALTVSPDGQNVSFVDYLSSANKLDVSNSNTPGITEPGNYTANPTPRTIVNLNANGAVTAVLPTNAYPGNNGRSVVNVGGTYYLSGNAGNASGSPAVTAASGVQILNPATATTTNGALNTTSAGSYNFQTNPNAATVDPGSSSGKTYGAEDKAAKDNNYRSLTVFDNTLYTTKGSGSNGVNTVYQVGTAGTLPTGGAAISILPGFNTLPARSTASAALPFATFFANATTLYVTDEGSGANKASTTAGSLTASDLATAAGDASAGLQKWSLVGGVWTLDYTLQAGLNLGIAYTVSGTTTGGDSGSYTAAADGLRNLAGRVNADGSVSLFAVTSTISAAGDEGADPNQLVGLTDMLGDTTAAQASGESFTVDQTAAYGQVLRGVAFTPVPEPASIAVFSLAVAGLGAVRRRRK